MLLLSMALMSFRNRRKQSRQRPCLVPIPGGVAKQSSSGLLLQHVSASSASPRSLYPLTLTHYPLFTSARHSCLKRRRAWAFQACLGGRQGPPGRRGGRQHDMSMALDCELSLAFAATPRSARICSAHTISRPSSCANRRRSAAAPTATAARCRGLLRTLPPSQPPVASTSLDWVWTHQPHAVHQRDCVRCAGTCKRAFRLSGNNEYK